jgi:catechol 2,3-dioxygenase-like lactoylglutathione lyase family enzyme
MGDDRNSQMDRRQFWTSAAAWALLAASHDKVAGAALGSTPTPARGGNATPRIVGLRLLTTASPAEMKDFYQGLLGLPVLDERPGEITFAAGASRLTFVHVETGNGDPFYHFAFNIPENKILAARKWQKERTRLIPPGEDQRDPDYPDDVVDYSHWNAHSIFFWDPGGNLVEYIARHDLENSAPGPFGTEDILYASEIAFIVDDVRDTAAEIEKAFGLEQYRGGSHAFTAVGDERGLLLVMERGRMLGFGEARPADCFPTIARIHGSEPARYPFPDLPYEITAG